MLLGKESVQFVDHLVKEWAAGQSRQLFVRMFGTSAVFSGISFPSLLSFVKVRGSRRNVFQLVFHCYRAIQGSMQRKESVCLHTNLYHKNVR